MNSYTALVELKCSKCGGTIAPGNSFHAEIYQSLAADFVRDLPGLGTGVYKGTVNYRICIECLSDEGDGE